MILTHRIELDPTDAQRRYFAKAAGCSRLVYNIALDEWNKRYKDTKNIPNWMELQKDFNAQKYFAFPWMKEIHRDAHARPFRNLSEAFSSFFKKISGHPKFKKKGKCKDSFYVANDQMNFNNTIVRLPKVGFINMFQKLRFDGKIMGATVHRIADKWFISISVDVGEYKKKRTGNESVGADVGIKTVLALSTGEKIDGPKPLKKELRRLKRISRKRDKQTLGGKNRAKTNKKIAKLHARVANIRKDFWHKVTTRLCRENQAIAIEDLNVAGMKQNRRVSRALEDVAIGMMKPMLEYKSKIYDNTIVKVDRWFPSSKTCSVCGFVKEKFSLSERTFHCESCGATLDRDVNAAINLRNKIPLVKRKFTPEETSRLGPSMNQETLQACGY